MSSDFERDRVATLCSRLRDLRSILQAGFSPETAAPGYSGTAPSTGQCAATAVVLYDILGGDLVSTRVGGVSHWFNRLRFEGEEFDVDLTGDQFGYEPVQIGGPGDLYPGTRTRRESEINSETVHRARVLARASQILARVGESSKLHLLGNLSEGPTPTE